MVITLSCNVHNCFIINARCIIWLSFSLFFLVLFFFIIIIISSSSICSMQKFTKLSSLFTCIPKTLTRVLVKLQSFRNTNRLDRKSLLCLIASNADKESRGYFRCAPIEASAPEAGVTVYTGRYDRLPQTIATYCLELTSFFQSVLKIISLYSGIYFIYFLKMFFHINIFKIVDIKVHTSGDFI